MSLFIVLKDDLVGVFTLLLRGGQVHSVAGGRGHENATVLIFLDGRQEGEWCDKHPEQLAPEL